MKRQCLFLLFFTFLSMCFVGCSKKCPDFNSDIINWIPYKVNDKIVFSVQTFFDTLTINYSAIHHVNEIGFGTDCSCENAFILNLSSDSINIDIRFNDSRLIEQSEIVINNEWMNYSKQLADTIINGKSYTDLIIYKNTNQNSEWRFKKIIISKSIGIIIINEENIEWIVVDDLIKPIEISDIEFKSTDC